MSQQTSLESFPFRFEITILLKRRTTLICFHYNAAEATSTLVRRLKGVNIVDSLFFSTRMTRATSAHVTHWSFYTTSDTRMVTWYSFSRRLTLRWEASCDLLSIIPPSVTSTSQESRRIDSSSVLLCYNTTDGASVTGEGGGG